MVVITRDDVQVARKKKESVPDGRHPERFQGCRWCKCGPTLGTTGIVKNGIRHAKSWRNQRRGRNTPMRNALGHSPGNDTDGTGFQTA
jgi:hypothetical protein